MTQWARLVNHILAKWSYFTNLGPRFHCNKGTFPINWPNDIQTITIYRNILPTKETTPSYTELLKVTKLLQVEHIRICFGIPQHQKKCAGLSQTRFWQQFQKKRRETIGPINKFQILSLWNCDFDHLPLPFLCFLHKTHGQYQPQSRRHQWKTMKNSNPQSTPSSKGSQPVHDSWLMSSACGWKTSSWNNKRKKNTVLVKHGWLREKTKQPWQWYNLYSSSLCSQQLVPGSHLRMVCRVEQWHKDLMCRETQWIPCKSSYIISF